MKKIINSDLIKIFLSIIFLIIGLILNNNILLIISYVFVSIEVYINAFKNIKDGNIFDENTLMIVATLGAFYIGEFKESVFVMLLFSIGEYLSDLAVESSKDAILNLVDLRSATFNLKGVGKTDVKKAKIGDVFIVAPGEKIPLDGIVLKGESHSDTSSLTGESVPYRIIRGNKVLSGCINMEGTLEIKATSTYEGSMASKIIEMLENSNEKKANAEKFITKFSKIYTPCVILLALLVVIVPFLLGYDFNTWVYRALEILVISCPCALVISIPLGYFCGIGKCSKEGILIKSSNVLDALVDIDTIIFDKTGTITEGVFEVNKMYSVNGNKEELLKLASSVEMYSNHPIALSIKNAYGKDEYFKVSDVKEISGGGIKAKINKDTILMGNEDFLKNEGINFKKVNEVGTVIYASKNKEYLGFIVISDKIKENAKDSLDNLKNLGIKKLVILSGDDKRVVKQIANELNIDYYHGNLLPLDKVKFIKEYQKTGRLAFVGDGINDAPVIKCADVGIAMGGIGSDAAVEASDMVIMQDNLNKLGESIKISKLTRRIVMANIYFAISFKILMIILALWGKTPMWLAVFADVGVTILSIINSLRIFKNR